MSRLRSMHCIAVPAHDAKHPFAEDKRRTFGRMLGKERIGKVSEFSEIGVISWIF